MERSRPPRCHVASGEFRSERPAHEPGCRHLCQRRDDPLPGFQRRLHQIRGLGPPITALSLWWAVPTLQSLADAG